MDWEGCAEQPLCAVLYKVLYFLSTFPAFTAMAYCMLPLQPAALLDCFSC